MLREKFVLLRFLHANFSPRNPISFLQFPSFCLSPMYVRLRIKLRESRLIVSMDKSDDSRAKIDRQKDREQGKCCNKIDTNIYIYLFTTSLYANIKYSVSFISPTSFYLRGIFHVSLYPLYYHSLSGRKKKKNSKDENKLDG